VIIKAFTGNGFAGLARYTLEKPGRYIGGRTGTWEDLSAEMAQLRDANPVRNPVFHYSLAIRPGEILSDDQWHDAARALLRHLGLTANLYRAQMHLDTAHPHVHVFGSRIRSDTFRKVSPDFEKRRAFAFARQLEQQYGLTRLNGPKQGVQNLISPHSRLRYLIDLAAARNPGYVPFVQALGKFGIQAVPNLTGGHISGITDGFLKLLSDGERVLGVHIVGDGATELIHLGQLAIINDMPVSGFVDNVFNFPTLAEAYRIAALDIVHQRSAVAAAAE